MSNIPWTELGDAPLDLIGAMLEKQRQAYGQLLPHLNNFEPEVSVAMTALKASPFLGYFDKMRKLPDMMIVEGMPAHLAIQLVDYQIHSGRLARTLEQSRFTPKFSPHVHRSVQYRGLDESVEADSIDPSRLRW